MTFNNLNQRSASPDFVFRRRNAKLIKDCTNKSMSIRRRRMELRRIRALTKGKPSSNSSNCDLESEAKLVVFPQNDVGSSTRRGNSHGIISVIGRRREMEDAAAVELGFVTKGGKSYDFFGVYDGHGGCGVADACGEMLHEFLGGILRDEESGGGEVINWEKVMGEGFKKMDDEVNKNGDELETTGSTAVVAVVGDEEVVVANCGDSRAVLCRGGVAVQLSDDHKPDRPDELERIEVSGGKVINWNGQRVLGVLATSRSIGDQYLKPYVITEPEVKVVNRSGSEEFLILASDGLWDVVSNDLACQVVRRTFAGQMGRSSDSEGGDETINDSRASNAAAVLAELAMSRGSRDNISVVVVEL